MRRATLSVIAAFTLSACSNDNEISVLTAKVNDLEQKVSELTTDKSWRELSETMEQVAYLTPGDTGYSVIKTDLGLITVSLENIKAYANGSKVTIRFGNVSSAEISGTSAQIEWGRVDAKGSPDNENQRSRVIEFKKSFKPGSWNNLEVILDGVPPTELGYVRVSKMFHKRISLRNG